MTRKCNKSVNINNNIESTSNSTTKNNSDEDEDVAYRTAARYTAMQFCPVDVSILGKR